MSSIARSACRSKGLLRLPEFLIGGAPRAGTTWLYWLLDRHPSIYMAKPLKPEPKFFLVDHLYEKGLEHYARTWFADAGGAALAGEKSTDYLESAPAAGRIARDLPDVKLVFILREPVDRAYSNYLWTTMNGLETEDFATALRLEATRERELPERLRFARPYSYFSRGLYADLLKEYVDRFSREQILVLRFEDIVGAPRRLAETLHGFLGVESRPGDVDGLGVINPSDRTAGSELPEAVRRDLQARYAEPNQRLARLLGPQFPMWP
jgi:sulfotransferase family protein